MNTSVTIRNGNILTPLGRLEKLDVRVEGGLITDVDSNIRGNDEIDADGGHVLPGLVDIHTHGIGLESVWRGSILDYCQLEAAAGATTVYPTLFGPPEESVDHLNRLRKETNDLKATPQIGGFRLESPYLARTGAGTLTDLVPISRKITDMLIHAGGGCVKIWDVSPELTDATDEISYLTSRGIVVSMAHTAATIEQARAAVDAGTRLVTHLFDTFVVPTMVDPGVYPAGLVDYLLVEDRVICEIVADGTHVHPMLVEKARRCKGLDKLVFVTDSNYGAGLPPGDYDLPGGWGMSRITSRNNGVRLIDRDMSLAGSAITPIDAFRNGIQIFGWSIRDASKVCSAIPARLMGLNAGEITVGRRADMIVLDSELNLRYTICNGQVIYQA